MDLPKQEKLYKHTFTESTLFVSGTFLINFLVIGLSYTSGVFQLRFIEEFKSSAGLTSLVGAIHMAALFEIGPVAHYLLSKCECVVVIFIGSVLTVAGLIGTVFAPNIYVVLVCYGLVTGSGNGLMHIASISAATVKIKHNRAICLGIAMAGGSVGGMVTAPLDNILISSFGWRGAILILAAINIHGVFASQLIWVAIHVNERRKRKLKYIQHLSVISIGRVPDTSQLYNEESQQKFQSMWKNPSFWAICVSNASTFFGLTILMVHVSPFAEYSGVSSRLASILLGSIAIGSFIGRLFWGLLLTHLNINAYFAFVIGHLTLALTCIVWVLWPNYIYMYVLLILCGVSLGSHSAPLFEILLQTVGDKQYSKGYAYISCIAGIGNLLGAPCAGYLYDSTLIYSYSFYLCGGVILLGVCCMYLPIMMQKRKRVNLKPSSLTQEKKLKFFSDACIGLKYNHFEL